VVTWGIGLIGATAIAERAVIGPADGLAEFSVRAVAASATDRALSFGKRHGLRASPSYEDLLTAPDIDVVYVSLHNSAHVEWACRAARMGRVVLVEKPLCLSLAEYDALAEAERGGGGRVLEALPTLGHPWHSTVRELMDRGSYGRLRSVRSRFVFGRPAAGSYRDRRDLGGGVFLDVASYWLQALQETVGLPKSGGSGVARCAEPYGVDQAFESELPLGEGISATLSCAFGGRHAAEHTFEFAEALVRVRGVLLPAAGSVPLHVTIRTPAGRTEVMRTPAIAYYPRQLARLADLLAGRGGNWGAELAAARPRVAAMERIHRKARRDVVPAPPEKEHS
jgi:predicted dehydrogenase